MTIRALPSLALAAWLTTAAAGQAPAAPQPEPAAPRAESAAPPAARPSTDFPSAVRAGKEALESGDLEAAIAAYDAALEARPDSADAAFNRGVALYRAGRFKDAAEAFKSAGTKASTGDRTNAALESSSTFNRAASFYGATKAQAEAAQRMLEQAKDAGPDDAGAATPTVDPEQLKQAIKDAQSSFENFRDAAYGSPDDPDARANAEQARRLVRALQELQRQQQQQQQDQKKNEGKDQQQQQPQDGDQQPSQSDQQPEQSSETQQGQESKPDDPQNQAKEPPSDGDQDKGQEPKEQPSDGQKKDEGQGQQQPPPQQQQEESAKDTQASQGQASPRDGTMTKDEADRLLQAVRDRERKRRAEQVKREQEQAARGRKPVKDW